MDFEGIRLDLDKQEPEPAEVVAFFARVKKVAAVASVIGAVLGICFAIGWAVHLMQSGKPFNFRLILYPAAFAMGLGAMVTGSFLLFAPEIMFKSATGRGYMKSIGTSSVAQAKVAIAVGLLVGCALVVVFLFGALQLVGVIG